MLVVETLFLSIQVMRYGKLYLNNLFLDGVLDQFPPVVQVELFHHVGTVHLHGLDGQAEDLTDLLVCVAFSNQLQDFALTRCQAVLISSRADIAEAQVIFDHQAGDGGREHRLTAADGANGIDQVPSDRIFEDVCVPTYVDAEQAV